MTSKVLQNTLKHCVGNDVNKLCHTWYGFCDTPLTEDVRCSYCYNKMKPYITKYKPMFKFELADITKHNYEIACDTIHDKNVSSVRVDDFCIQVLSENNRSIPFLFKQDDDVIGLYNVDMPHNTDYCFKIMHNSKNTLFGRSDEYFTVSVNGITSQSKYYSELAYIDNFLYDAYDKENVVNLTIRTFIRDYDTQSWFGHHIVSYKNNVNDEGNLVSRPLKDNSDAAFNVVHTFDTFTFLKQFTIAFHMNDVDFQCIELTDLNQETKHIDNDYIINANGIIPVFQPINEEVIKEEVIKEAVKEEVIKEEPKEIDLELGISQDNTQDINQDKKEEHEEFIIV